MIDEIRAAVSLPMQDKNLNKKAVVQLHDSFFNLKTCNTCESGWQSAYLKLKDYLKKYDMAGKSKKNTIKSPGKTYQFIDEVKGAVITIHNVGEFTDKDITEEIYNKHIKGKSTEKLFITDGPQV